MAKTTYAALDKTGTQAAIYPSEEALWVTGPPINDSGDQGMFAAQEFPVDQMTTAQEDDWLHEVVNGETSNAAIDESWVNNMVYGPQGFGDWNEQAYETGHTQIIQADPAAEQGWGVGPARRWAHYPKTDSPNPTRNFGTHNRNGQLPWVAASSSLYERSQLAWEAQWQPYKYRSPVSPVVPVPVSVPFVQVVPTFGGGPSPHPGVDLPVGDEGVFG